MLRFCANLKWLFTEHEFLDRFEAAAKAGFRGVEYPSPYEYTPGEIRSRLQACGLKQVLINTPPGNLADGGGSGLACVPGQTENFRDSLKKAIDYAVNLDCALVHLWGGVKAPGVADDLAAAVYAVNVAWAAEFAAKSGIRLVLEPQNQHDSPGFFLRTQEQAFSVIEAVGRKNLGLQFDLYHCQISQGDLTRRMAALMPVIAHMQIADVPGRNEPGTGELAWDHIFRTIQDLEYQGWIGLEYRPAVDTVNGLGWRERYGIRSFFV